MEGLPRPAGRCAGGQHKAATLCTAGSSSKHPAVHPQSPCSTPTVGSEVHNLPPEQQHETVEELEAVGAGGVDGGAHRDAVAGQLLHHAHDLVGGVGVEAGGGFVCEGKGAGGTEWQGEEM